MRKLRGNKKAVTQQADASPRLRLVVRGAGSSAEPTRAPRDLETLERGQSGIWVTRSAALRLVSVADTADGAAELEQARIAQLADRARVRELAEFVGADPRALAAGLFEATRLDASLRVMGLAPGVDGRPDADRAG